MSFITSKGTNRVVGLVLLGSWILGSLPAVALTPEASRRVLDQAEKHYIFGEYQEALDNLELVREDETLTEELRFEILIMRGRCLVGLDLPDLAGEPFCSAHLLDSAWQPESSDIEFTAEESAEFQRATVDCKAPGGGTLKWILGGVGLVALAGILFSGSGSEDEEGKPGTSVLADFPDMP